MKCAEEVNGTAIVASGDAAVALQPAEKAFDAIAELVSDRIVPSGMLSGWLGGNDGDRTDLGDGGAKVGGIVGAVGDDVPRRLALKQRGRMNHVAGLS